MDKENRRYFLIDILKLIFAFVIAINHFLLKKRIDVHLYNIITTMVGFFFATSGFFLFKKIKKIEVIKEK